MFLIPHIQGIKKIIQAQKRKEKSTNKRKGRSSNRPNWAWLRVETILTVYNCITNETNTSQRQGHFFSFLYLFIFYFSFNRSEKERLNSQYETYILLLTMMSIENKIRIN